MDCRRGSFNIADAMGGGGVFPLEGLGGFGVSVDVAAELAGQVSGGGEDATSDDVALQFGKPQFDLVEPRRIGGGEVELHVGMGVEKGSHAFSLMSREIVENDMNLLLRFTQGNNLAQEGDEVLTGVPQSGFAVDLASGGPVCEMRTPSLSRLWFIA